MNMALIAVAVMILQSKASIYPTCGVITEVTEETATFEDCKGNLWEFSEPEDYEVGDIVSVIMSDSGTETIYDDEIITVQYCGYER